MKKPADHATQVVLLIENRLLRETLVRLFRKRADVCVVGQSSPAEAIGLAAPACDILVLDDLHTASLLSANFHLDHQDEAPAGLVLIGMEDEDDQFIAAVKCGVSGYLLNDASASDVVGAVRAVANGEAVCPPGLCLALFRSVARAAKEAPPPNRMASTRGLTIRQQQLISLVAKGLTNKEIAYQLNVSEYTIKNHLHRIMKQVEVVSRQEAVEAARACGYIATV